MNNAERMKKYRLAHRESTLNYSKKYRDANRDKRLIYAKNYRQKNREKCLSYQRRYAVINVEKIRERRLRKFHGLTLDRYNELSRLQLNGCASCLEKVSKLHIDHDHKCCPQNKSCSKCRRGLLCGNCNKALGLLMDDLGKIESLLKYLRKFKGENQ